MIDESTLQQSNGIWLCDRWSLPTMNQSVVENKKTPDNVEDLRDEESVEVKSKKC